MSEESTSKGSALIDEGRFDEALDVLRPEISLNPKDWYAWYLAGQCYRFKQDTDNATLYLSRAAELKPDAPSVSLALGIAHQLAERWDAAIDAFRRAIELDRNYAAAYNSLALTQKKRGELDKAAHNYDAGLKALARHIAGGLRNDRSSRIFKHEDTSGHLWVQHALYAALYLVTLESGEKRPDSMSLPTSEMAEEEEQTERHGGLYWTDFEDTDKRTVRLLHPNFLNTFREAFRATNTYSLILGNLGTVLELLGRQDEAQEHFIEADEFGRRVRVPNGEATSH